MDFADRIKELAGQLEKNMDHVFTEEATKHSLVMPFLQVMGYNVFDPMEVIPEFTTDLVGRNEKVDYAIAFNKEPTILIEVKRPRTLLKVEKVPQLMKYFNFTKSKFAILTNGIQYQFFSDLDDINKMDTIPFLTIDLIPSIRDSEIAELKKFHKENFDAEIISSSAIELKYTGEIKKFLKKQFKSPDDDDFKKVLIKNTSLKGFVTKPILEKFQPIIINAFDQYIKEIVGDTLKGALEKTKEGEPGKVMKPKDELRLHFWTQLLGYAKTKTDLHSNLKPANGGWIATGGGMSGLGYCYTITKHQGGIELYIFRGKDSKQENERIFSRFFEAKNEIEKNFGGPLEWERLEDKQACRIKKTITEGGYLDEQNWPKVYESMVESMIALEKALVPYIKIIKGELE